MTARNRIRPNRPSRQGDDTPMVLEAANALDVTEFELFDLAHRAWFDRPGESRELEQAFGPYMMHGQAPYWVRHFARRIAALPDSRQRQRLHYSLRPEAAAPPPQPPPAGRLYVLITAAVFAVFFLMLLDVTYDPNTSASMTCRGGPGMESFVGSVARAFGADIGC